MLWVVIIARLRWFLNTEIIPVLGSKNSEIIVVVQAESVHRRHTKKNVGVYAANALKYAAVKLLKLSFYSG